MHLTFYINIIKIHGKTGVWKVMTFYQRGYKNKCKLDLFKKYSVRKVIAVLNQKINNTQQTPLIPNTFNFKDNKPTERQTFNSTSKEIWNYFRKKNLKDHFQLICFSMFCHLRNVLVIETRKICLLNLVSTEDVDPPHPINLILFGVVGL